MKTYLRFANREVEKAFLAHYAETAIPGIRMGYWLATILYALFSILDYFLMPESYRTMWFIRFAIVIPVATVTYLMTYNKSLHRYMQFAISASSLIMGLGIVAMMALARESEPGYTFYYAGIILVIMGIATLFGLRFHYAVFCLLCLVAGYELSLIFIQRIYPSSTPDAKSVIFINNNFFFIGANIMGIIIAYLFEISKRIEFLQQEEIKSRNSEIIQHAREMKRELELAKQLQLRLLPDVYPEIPGVKFSLLYRPMEDLGGDYYDYIKFAEEHMIGIFISDVSGHGLPAALITSMLKSLIAASEKVKFSVSDFLHYINTHASGIIGDNFITALYALYDSKSRILKFARAGHPFPLILRKGKVIQVKSRGGMIGYNPYASYAETEVQLEPGDKVLLFTDGLIEEINDESQSFESTFMEKVLPSLSMMPITDVVAVSFRRLVEFKGSSDFMDDICILGMEVL
jgi:serine phosphatase RsbU (regulator of sigma subunit)